jgi:hypothetical protein
VDLQVQEELAGVVTLEIQEVLAQPILDLEVAVEVYQAVELLAVLAVQAL